MVAVNSQVYYDAARDLTKIGGDIDAATTTLVKALVDTESMAGTSAAATAWAASYDARASSVIDNARGLGQTLPYFAGLIALAGYNPSWRTTTPTPTPTRVPLRPNPQRSPRPRHCAGPVPRRREVPAMAWFRWAR